MSPQTDQNSFTGIPDRYSPAGQSAPNPKVTRIVIAAIIVVAVLLTAWSLLAAARQRAEMSAVIINVSGGTDAEVTLFRPDADPLPVGKGSTIKTRILPGIYTIVAANGDRQALRTATIEDTGTTTVDISLGDAVKQQTVIYGAATNAMGFGSTIYFLNPKTQTANSVAIGNSASRPFMSTLYPLGGIYWISPDRFFALQNNNWKYVENKKPVSLDMPPNNDYYDAEWNRPTISVPTISFTPSGAYAFISEDNHVYIADSPASIPRKIAELTSDTYRVSLAPNGSVLAYPRFNNPSGTQKPHIVKDGSAHQVDIGSDEVYYAAWSPDSRKISFTTQDGVYVYDVATKQKTQLIHAAPADDKGIIWSNNDTLLYTFNKRIWKHTPSTKSDTMVASYEGALGAYSPLRVDTDGFLYFGTSGNSDETSGVFRAAVSGVALNNDLTSSKPTVYRNLNILADQGLSSGHVTNARYAIGTYLKEQKVKPEEIQFITDSFKDLPNRRDGIGRLEFTFEVDGSTRKARLEYQGLAEVRLFVLGDGGKTVYDSGPVKN